MSNKESHDQAEGIAIVGMSGRFPQARNVDEFWRNLRDGVEAVSFFTAEELAAEGVDPELLADPGYVRAKAVLDDIELFDASFFGFSPKEAEMMDPQQRFFLECAWEALESAGYDSEQYEGAVGVYAGVSLNSYLLLNLLTSPGLLEEAGILQSSIRNRTDHLTTRVAYKLNLSGPGITVQTACSTALVAVHLACQGLLDYQCDMALAGGVTIGVPKKSGYLYQEGGVLSADGHCRAFDEKADGTTVGNGVGIVALKRLSDALADGDTIHAVIKGSAINNDGSDKVGYTAPSVNGQSEVIAMAQAVAGVEPDSISYIETHGTGTALGDPIEVAALTRVFRQRTDRKNFCALGSVKTNIGHLDVAAGVAGLIKTALALKHRAIPPSLHFERPNPQIDFSDTPFYVNSQLSAWEATGAPRRAGVSSFGIGGTNAHLILEEAPEPEASGESRPHQLLVLSAKTSSALETATANLSEFLKQNPGANLADVAYTLQVGRRAFNHRRTVVCRDAEDAIKALDTLDPRRVVVGLQKPKERPVAFMFPGQGAQYADMGRGLYETEATFRAQVDWCSEHLKPHLGFDLREALFPREGQLAEGEERLKQTSVTQPALFVVEYALAKLWMEWGVRPGAMIGHSVGEYVAACLAGVFSVEDALELVAARGRLMESVPGGSMLSISLPEREVRPMLEGGLSLAAVNSPSLCVVSGASGEVDALEARLGEKGVACRRLKTSHAFHSGMMEPVLERFVAEVSRRRLSPPSIPFVSNLTGTWITAAEATDPQYWARHLRQTVRFGDGVAQLFAEPDSVLLEVGPGRTLMTIARWHPAKAAGQSVLTSLPRAEDRGEDSTVLLDSLGRLWISGVIVDWGGFYARARRRRLTLPTYPFERQRYWIEPQKRARGGGVEEKSLRKKADIAEWFHVPSWRRSAVPPGGGREGDGRGSSCLIFLDDAGVGAQVAEGLRSSGREVWTVRPGERFGEAGESEFTIDPQRRGDYEELLNRLGSRGRKLTDIVHLWNLTREGGPLGDESSERIQRLGFYALLNLAQALGERPELRPLRVSVVTNDMQQVTGAETLCPEKATVLGPCKVIPQEYEGVTCRSIDVALPGAGERGPDSTGETLLAELLAATDDAVVAYRNSRRWVQTFEPHRLEKAADEKARLRPKGVYLITGGMGGIGLVLAEHLAKTVQARLVLVGRSPFPAREQWEGWLATHGEGDAVARRMRKVRELEKLGGEVLVLSADVTSREEMRRAVEEANSRFGRVDGVIHAAGVPGGGMIQLKTPEKAADILAPKVQGARVLGSIFEGAGPDFILLCSSRSSILGGFGQVDYCAANAFLDAFAASHTAVRGTFTVSVDWDGWQDVGMLVDTAAHYGVGQPTEAGHLETGHPLLGRRVSEAGGREVYVKEFGIADSWILEEHRIGGTAVLPGVTYLEMARAAFERHADGAGIEMRDVYFISPMNIKDDEKRDVRFVLERDGDGYRFSASSKPSEDKGPDPAWQEHVFGRIERAPRRPAKTHDIDALIARCGGERSVAAEQERDPDLGPRWQNIRKAYVGENEVLVLFELPEDFARDLETLKLHPALLDRAAGSGMLFMELDGVYLPFSYKRLSLAEPFPRKIYAHIKQTDDYYLKKETVSFDVLVTDEDGRELAEIEGFSEKRINDLTERIKARNEEARGAAVAEAVAQPERPAGRSFYEESIGEGISPKEGVEAFTRILARNTEPQIIVSTKDLAASIERANSFTQAQVSEEIEKLQVARPLHVRPEMQTSYVAPRDEVERTLAGIMQEMLGVERVGVNDNFFELGGDSVLSIQIIARANRIGMQITPQQIFQHQTVAELAAAVGREPGGTVTAAAPATEGAQHVQEDVQEASVPLAFDLAGLGKSKLSKLAKLIGEGDDDGEPDESEELIKAAEPVGNGGGARASVRAEPRQPEGEAFAPSPGDIGRGQDAAARAGSEGGRAGGGSAKEMKFSLFYFAADDSKSGRDKYRLYLEGAKYADLHGFTAVWTPERHFHESGGLYPSPTVLSAALAVVTERIHLRAGSVVMPLHHSIRVAEEWSIVDNLSKGRAGVSFTSGWIPNDFAFFPERYANKRDEMLRGIEEVRRLWRGGTIDARDGAGKEVRLKVLPRPVQPELPVWLTCSGAPEMFEKAGELGVNVLTALLSQTVDEVAGKIALYREARKRHGHDPEAGQVALMMHTYVGEDRERVLGKVRGPLSDYLKAHVGLIETMTKSLDIKVDIDKEQYLDYLVAFAFERYYQTASLIGTPASCLKMIERVKEIGVDEVACFIDFGVDAESVLDGLRHLNALKELSAAAPEPSRRAEEEAEPTSVR